MRFHCASAPKSHPQPGAESNAPHVRDKRKDEIGLPRQKDQMKLVLNPNQRRGNEKNDKSPEDHSVHPAGPRIAFDGSMSRKIIRKPCHTIPPTHLPWRGTAFCPKPRATGKPEDDPGRTNS